MRKTISVALLAVLSAFVVTGCGAAASGGGAATTPVAATDADPMEMDRQLARCMRDNGVDWPDPGPNGLPEGFDPTRLDQMALNVALQACAQYTVAEEDLPAPTPEDIEADRQLAQCMREKGIPMPDATGNQVLDELPGIDVTSPSFTAAFETCAQAALAPTSTGANG